MMFLLHIIALIFFMPALFITIPLHIIINLYSNKNKLDKEKQEDNEILNQMLLKSINGEKNNVEDITKEMKEVKEKKRIIERDQKNKRYLIYLAFMVMIFAIGFIPLDSINKDKVYMAENYIDAGPTMKSFYWNKLTKEEQERAIRMEKQYSNNK